MAISKVFKYDTLTEFTLAAKAARDKGRHTEGPSDFNDYTSFDAALELGRKGDDTKAAAAAAQMDRYSEVLPQTKGTERRYSPIGQLDVDAFMANMPMPFVQRKRIRRPVNTVRIFVSVNATYETSAKDMIQKGAAILALIMAVAPHRPVELYAYAECAPEGNDYNQYHVIRLESSPISVAHAAFAIGHPAFHRQLMFQVMYSHGAYAIRPIEYGTTPEAARLRQEALCLTEDDVVFFQRQAPTEGWEAWLKATVARFSGVAQ